MSIRVTGKNYTQRKYITNWSCQSKHLSNSFFFFLSQKRRPKPIKKMGSVYMKSIWIKARRLSKEKIKDIQIMTKRKRWFVNYLVLGTDRGKVKSPHRSSLLSTLLSTQEKQQKSKTAHFRNWVIRKSQQLHQMKRYRAQNQQTYILHFILSFLCACPLLHLILEGYVTYLFFPLF